MSLVVLIIMPALAAIALIVTGTHNLVNGAKQQTNVSEQTGVSIQKRKSVSTNATIAGWIKIGIGVAIIWVCVIRTVLLNLFNLL